MNQKVEIEAGFLHIENEAFVKLSEIAGITRSESDIDDVWFVKIITKGKTENIILQCDDGDAERTLYKHIVSALKGE